MDTNQKTPITISAPETDITRQILTPAALDFLCQLEETFGAQRIQCLNNRRRIQENLDAGGTLDFLSETADIRRSDWRVPPAPNDLLDRRVEITGPVDRKMVINALNSGACCYMADFEDSSTPTWSNLIAGQKNLIDAVQRTIDYSHPVSGKKYKLTDKPATLIVRPRGLHMTEAHITYKDRPLSASFFDFGLFLFHNARQLLENGSGPYFYLPKLEHYKEAALWSDVISLAEDLLELPRGTVRVTVLIETITAAFQMDEILYALKHHITGLNCGRWDYIFNFIKRFRRNPAFVLPGREQVGMTQPFLTAYSQLLIKTCHRRGAHAIGGMAAQIPIKEDEHQNAAALERVKADKEREASNGHDGTWVAHPALIPIAEQVFNTHMPTANQLNLLRDDVLVSAADLLKVPEGQITLAGYMNNIEVGILYLTAWLGGSGCVPIHHLMEDAATAEICRTQLWQWRTHRAKLATGETIDDAFTLEKLEDCAGRLKTKTPNDQCLEQAIQLFKDMIMAADLEEFLTTPAYAYVTGPSPVKQEQVPA